MAIIQYDNYSGQGSNKGIMGDFTHAAALYRRNDFRLAPKVKFLYHVVLEVNQAALSELGTNNLGNLKTEWNLLASGANLPTFTVATDTLNQYNRKKVIQTMINYDPVNIEFHDDNAGLTTLLWESYFRYYYSDGNYNNSSRPRQYQTKLYDSEIANINSHGFARTRSTDVPFFNSITIHQLHPQNRNSTFTSFTLVNPLIASWEHDRVDQSDASGTMKNIMRLEYETVLYNRGNSSDAKIAGFSNTEHYDKVTSPYSSTSSSSQRTSDTGLDLLWEDIFNSILNPKTTLTDFNTQQKQNQLFYSRSPLDNIKNPNPNANIYVPVENTIAFQAEAALRGFNKENTNTQEFKRSLRNNPKKLADYAEFKSKEYIAKSLGISINDAKAVYNNLSPNVKSQIEQAALDNVDELEKSPSLNRTPAFAAALSALGVTR